MNTYNRRQKLLDSLDNCFKEWADSFDVKIVHSSCDEDGKYDCYDVEVSHKYIGGTYKIYARVDCAGNCEFDFNEDHWEEITKENIFSYMWFVEAERKAPAN